MYRIPQNHKVFCKTHEAVQQIACVLTAEAAAQKQYQPDVLSFCKDEKPEAAGLAKAGEPGGPVEGVLSSPSSTFWDSCPKAPSNCPDLVF